MQQQKEKLKKGKQKLQKVQEKIHDIVNGDKNYKKKTETQNKWQLHKRNRNEEKIKVTGVLTRKIANLHQKKCLQQLTRTLDLSLPRPALALCLGRQNKE